MNYQNKTKEELINELQELQQKHNSLKTSYSKAISEFNLVERTLKESEEKYHLLFENIAEAFLITNQDGSIYSANPEACRIFGMGEDEICKLGRDGIVDLNDPQLNIALNERRKTGKFKGELNLLRKDGTKFPAEVTSAVFRDISGNERTSMIIRDISEKKQTEKQLHLQSEIMKNISEGICLVRLEDEKIVFTNPKFEKMFGYENGEMIGKHISVVNAPTNKSPEETKNAIMDVIIRTGEWHGEILNKKKNGDHFWCYANVSVFDHHDFGKVSSSFHSDITRHKKVEETLIESETRFRSLFDTSHVGVSAAGKDGRLLYANLAYARMYGYENPEIMLSEVPNVAKLYSNPEVRKEVIRTLHKYGKMKEKEFEVVRRDGSQFIVLIAENEVRDAEGKLLYNQATYIDLTERKKMETDLRNSKKSLEKLNQHLLEVRENERSQIALNLHDDFGQRLTALNLDIAWLKSRMGVQSEPVRKKFEEMSLMINDSIESIREVSSFLRPEVLYDLGLVPAIGWQLKKFEKQSGIHCQYTFVPWDIKIDDRISLILYRILQEALTNIVRHSEAATAVVDIRLERNRIEMVIKDDGKGIDENEINSLKSMGIAGMMERVRSVSGRMSIKGKKRSGTMMKISIPLKNSKKNDQRTYNR